MSMSPSFFSASSTVDAVTTRYPFCRRIVDRSSRFSSRSSSRSTRMGRVPLPLPMLVTSAIVRTETLLYVGDGFGVTLLFGFLSCNSDRFRELRQLVEHCNTPQPLPVVDRRISAHHLARVHIIRDSALRCGDGAISYGAVTCYADLSRQDHVLANDG